MGAKEDAAAVAATEFCKSIADSLRNKPKIVKF
jgi:hypothetical protein